MSARIQPHVWSALPRLSRRRVQRERALRRAAAAVFDVAALPGVLAALFGREVRVALVAGGSATAPDGARLWSIRLGLVPGGLELCVRLDPELAAQAVATTLDREWPPGTGPAAPEPELLGATTALLVECARRTTRSTGSFVVLRSQASAPELVLVASVTLDGRSHAVFVELAGGDALPCAPAAAGLLDRLGQMELELPVVAQPSLALPGELRTLSSGDVWLPGGRAWMERAALAPPLARHGASAEITSQGQLVLGGQRVELARDVEELGESMAETNQSADKPILDAVLDAPLVVRIELGSVSLSAREWAELQPGDVLETRQPIGQNVVLRVAGREVARGELVDVDGELGVRIQSLTGEGVPR